MAAEVPNIRHDKDEYGDITPIRDGEDGQRLRDTILMAHAPALLKVVQQALETAIHVVDDDARWVGDSDKADEVWCRLGEPQVELDKVLEGATFVT